MSLSERMKKVAELERALALKRDGAANFGSGGGALSAEAPTVPPNTIQADVWDTIPETGAIFAAEILERLHNLDMDAVASALGKLKKRGLIEKTKIRHKNPRTGRPAYKWRKLK